MRHATGFQVSRQRLTDSVVREWINGHLFERHWTDHQLTHLVDGRPRTLTSWISTRNRAVAEEVGGSTIEEYFDA